MKTIRKNLAVGIITCVLFIAASSTAFSLCGDVSGDGLILSNDVLMVARASIGTLTLTTEQKARADVTVSGTPDGLILSNDLLMIARASIGTLTSLNCAEGGSSDVDSIKTLVNTIYTAYYAEDAATVLSGLSNTFLMDGYSRTKWVANAQTDDWLYRSNCTFNVKSIDVVLGAGGTTAVVTTTDESSCDTSDPDETAISGLKTVYAERMEFNVIKENGVWKWNGDQEKADVEFETIVNKSGSVVNYFISPNVTANADYPISAVTVSGPGLSSPVLLLKDTNSQNNENRWIWKGTDWRIPVSTKPSVGDTYIFSVTFTDNTTPTTYTRRVVSAPRDSYFITLTSPAGGYIDSSNSSVTLAWNDITASVSEVGGISIWFCGGTNCSFSINRWGIPTTTRSISVPAAGLTAGNTINGEICYKDYGGDVSNRTCTQLTLTYGNNAKIKGDYTIFNLKADGVSSSPVWTMDSWATSCDGNGICTDSDDGGTVNYSVDSSDTVTLSPGTSSPPTGVYADVSSDGGIIVMSDGNTADDQVTLELGIKQGTGMSNASLNGTYNAVQIGADTNRTRPWATRGHIVFDGNGNASYQETADSDSSTMASGSGTYTVSSNGTLSIFFGKTQSGIVSADGNIFVMYFNDVNGCEFLIGIKTSSGLNVNSSNSHGKSHYMNAGRAAPYSVSTGLVSMVSNTTNGTGTATQTLIYNSEGYSNPTSTVNYTIDSYGVITVTSSPGTVGMTTSDGKFGAMASMTSDYVGLDINIGKP